MEETKNGIRNCIDECSDCHQVCLRTIHHCLGMGSKHAEQNHIRLMTDGAQICATSADFMLRESPLHALTCRACAEVCQRCAEDCERVGGGQDLQMKQCADVCRRSAESCRKMASGA